MRERAIVYPRNPMEEKLAKIWCDVLNLKEVSVEDSIFELGGDSLMIFRINTIANQAGIKTICPGYLSVQDDRGDLRAGSGEP